jgi:hypothetical protein
MMQVFKVLRTKSPNNEEENEGEFEEVGATKYGKRQRERVQRFVVIWQKDSCSICL